MAGVAAQAVGVEIVVAAGLGERLFFLKNTSSGWLSSEMWSLTSVSADSEHVNLQNKQLTLKP